MAILCYQDFDLLFERAENGYVARVLNSPAGQAAAAFHLPLNLARNFLTPFSKMSCAPAGAAVWTKPSGAIPVCAFVCVSPELRNWLICPGSTSTTPRAIVFFHSPLTRRSCVILICRNLSGLSQSNRPCACW